jgi:alanyl-tRNA synthetase
MGDAYPQLRDHETSVTEVLRQEEEQFARTLDKGMRVLEQDLAQLSGTVIPGRTVFTLYDTYGFPVDLTNDIARERGLTLDYDGYEQEMAQQRARARAASTFDVDYNAGVQLDGATEFSGYTDLSGPAKVMLVQGCAAEGALVAGEKGVVVLDRTPFYAESGGQEGDQGSLLWQGGRFVVEDTQKDGRHFVHLGWVAEGTLRAGVEVTTHVDPAARAATALNHSATHLLHSALRKVLGPHVQQKGSTVSAERLRFDFSHAAAVSDSELLQIETMVSEQIRANTPVITAVTDMESAREMGAMALFGEKYGDQVRVLSMGRDNFSVELCGGTHVSRTGDIAQFAIVSEGGVASGVRRIEAVTGAAADAYLRSANGALKALSTLLKCKRDDVVAKVEQTLQQQRQLERQLDQLKGRMAASAGVELSAKAESIGPVKVLAEQLEAMDRKALMETVDKLRNQLGSSVVLLASVDEAGKAVLIAGVSKDVCNQFPAGDLVRHVAEKLGGKGGGRPDMAQGGGEDLNAVPEALKSVRFWVESRL